MAHRAIDELERSRLARMTTDEHVDFHETFAVTRAALRVGEIVCEARRAAGLSQRELATRVRIGQAAVAHLEAGDVSAKLATIQKVATALHLRVTVDLSAAS